MHHPLQQEGLGRRRTNRQRMPPAGTTAVPRRQARSAARPRPRTQTAQKPLRIRWERVGRVLLVIVLAVVAGLYIQQGLAYLSAHSQANQQKAIVTRLRSENAQLARQQKSLNQPATIMQYARQLGMVQPGERPYVVTGLPGN
jgi:cell division protein FtsB